MPEGRATGKSQLQPNQRLTCHSLRHTFITDMMEASGNNVALVMSYSGHKSLESFKIYLHAPTHGCIATDQRIESVGLFLASFAGTRE